MKISLTIACILAIVAVGMAFPIEQEEANATTEILLDLTQQETKESAEEVKRVTRGLGGIGFGGHGFGHGFGGGFGGLGGFGGHGLGGFGLHGLGGFGGLGGFKKPWSFKGF